jgi:short chain dehydrogenase
MYHATKWGIEGFAESVAQEVAPFGIGVTIVEPGGARTEFRYGSAQVADLLPAYDGTPAHGFLALLDPANGLAPGDPARMAAAIITSADQEPAPLRLILGSQALKTTVGVLKDRVAGFEARADLAASTDFPPSSLPILSRVRPPPTPTGPSARVAAFRTTWVAIGPPGSLGQ